MLISRDLVERSNIRIVGKFDEWLPPVRIDSRLLKEGDLFWALPGENVDGHDYVYAAFKAGAAICAVSEEWAAAEAGGLPESSVLFVMDDPLKGLQALAGEVRRSLGCSTIGLTGSNGKTTTKELVGAVLGAMGRTTATRGNYNNHIGLPLTILNATGDEEYLVLEMGANHVGEIEYLSRIAHPELGLITNIGDAHVGEFGGFDLLQKAKGELFGFLSEINGLAVVNLDDERVVDESRQVRRRAGYTVGFDRMPSDWIDTIHLGRVLAEDSWSRATLDIEGVTVKLDLIGRHWANAAMAAASVALELGGVPEDVLPALETVSPLPGRGKIHQLGDGVEVLDDSYNANVASIEASVTTLNRRDGSRIAVFGDVMELGEFEEDEHRRIGRIPGLDDIDHLVFVGERMSWAAEEATLMGHPSVRSYVESDIATIAADLEPLLIDGAGMVVKGSRKTGLDRLVTALTDSRDEGGER